MFRRILYCLIPVLTSGASATDGAAEDPTAPDRWVAEVVVEERDQVPVLSSVLIGQSRKLVVIDGQLMGEGEQRGDIRVWQIEADHAVVSIGGGSTTRLWLDKHDLNKEVQ